MHRLVTVVLLAGSLVASTVGCERKSEGDDQTAKQAAQQEDTGSADGPGEDTGGQAEEASGTGGDARTITLEPVDNQMKYATTELTAEAGEKIHLVFDNTATAQAMKHNVVLLENDDSETAMEVARAGWKMPDQEYVPDHDAVLATTDMADPGETVEMTFTAPDEPGEYLYICTFPGHYPTMKGTLVVEDP